LQPPIEPGPGILEFHVQPPGYDWNANGVAQSTDSAIMTHPGALLATEPDQQMGSHGSVAWWYAAGRTRVQALSINQPGR
jgi:hypothetical protein